MKKHSSLLALSVLPFLIGCDKTTTSTDSHKDSENQPLQYINDHKFERGFLVNPADRSWQDGTTPDNHWSLDSRLYYGGNEKDKFAWIVHQAGDHYGLGDVYNVTTDNKPSFADGFYKFEDSSKSLSVNPTEGKIRYELNTSKEYEAPRKAMEPWCHLLLQQGLAHKVILKECTELNFAFEATLEKMEDHLGSAYNSSIHACQFLIYFICQTGASLDVGNYLWFGVPVYDSRHLAIPEYGNVDAGTSGNTGQFIYSMSTESYLPDGMKIGEKCAVSLNLKEKIAHGLRFAQSKGKLTHTTVDDLTIEYMNMGYEIPGTYDSAMTIGGLSLTSK